MSYFPYLPAGLILLSTLFTVLLFLKAARFARPVLLLVAGWLVLQGLVAFTGFYEDHSVLPPRFLLLVLPPNLFILFLFLSRRGRAFLDSLDTKNLTLLHLVRVPVEIVLFLLFLQGQVPQAMTFEGYNFDILSGISCLPVFFLAAAKQNLSRGLLLSWNLTCLFLLLIIVVIALLSAPYPFQQLAFDQPNVAVFRFPFVFLPGLIVPMVLLSHLVVIRKTLGPGAGPVLEPAARPMPRQNA